MIHRPTERLTLNLSGRYRDVLRGPDGRVVSDSGWRSNAIVVDCRRLLSGLMKNEADTAGILALKIGSGLQVWDVAPYQPDGEEAALEDSNPWSLPAAQMTIQYLDENRVPTSTPKRDLQVKAQFGPNQPPWPDANHATPTLREFGLWGRVGGDDVMINYVTHHRIIKDPTSTLDRTIWLTF